MEAAALLVANVAQTIVVKPATSVVKTLVAQMDLIVAPMVVVASRAITASAAAAVPLERSALATVGSVMIKASRLVLMTTIAAQLEIHVSETVTTRVSAAAAEALLLLLLLPRLGLPRLRELLLRTGLQPYQLLPAVLALHRRRPLPRRLRLLAQPLASPKLRSIIKLLISDLPGAVAVGSPAVRVALATQSAQMSLESPLLSWLLLLRRSTLALTA